MPSTKILFIVPDDVQRLGEIICDEGGIVDDEQFETYDDAVAYLSDLKGNRISVEFEDLFDTLEPLNAISDELDNQKSPYLGVAEAFEESSRGDRFDGTIVYNLFGEQEGVTRLTYPWSHGSPELDERTLRLAGVSDEKVAEIAAEMFSGPKVSPASVPSI